MFYLAFEQWEVFLNHIPKYVKVNSKVIVDKNMSHFLNGSPWCVWVLLLELMR